MDISLPTKVFSDVSFFLKLVIFFKVNAKSKLLDYHVKGS